MTSLASSPWRIAWSERENQRRQHAYRDATDAWLRRDDHLARLRIEAASFLGCTQPRTGLPVDLDDDELVFRVLPVATLVEAEARHVPGLPTPGMCSLAETSSEELPPGLRIVDTGMAVVTSRRVAFGGREHRREWRYADLIGLAHHPDVPVTLLPDRGRLSGLLVPTGAVVNFRFYLTLAAAADRAVVLSHVDALLAEHRAARPTPLPLVGPDDAPLTAVRPDRRVLVVAAVAAMVVATVGPGVLGPSASGPRASGAVSLAEVVVMDLPRAGEILVPIGPVGPMAPKVRTRSVNRAAPNWPYTPSSTTPIRPDASTVAKPAIAVALPSAAPPSIAPTPPASSAPTPGPVPTTDPPTSAPPTSPAASASPTPSATPTATPSSDPGLLTICLDPLELPLLDPLLCPSSTP
ncbi:hypothetical protein [Micromonospora sp. CPCC 205558]|uniref:hypothetical protein n=1 Tax=Micromonospora sp. CPCC 205558 TaxID=3122403 RepID=UPI002FF07832